MNRRKLREQIFKLLFGVEFNEKAEIPLQVKLFFEDEDNAADAQDTQYITDKFNEIVNKIPEMDALVNEVAQGWSTSRMGKVELTLIRIATYEMLYDESVPTSVAINEAVELCKKFGQEESAGFVNGVLAKVAKQNAS